MDLRFSQLSVKAIEGHVTTVSREPSCCFVLVLTNNKRRGQVTSSSLLAGILCRRIGVIELGRHGRYTFIALSRSTPWKRTFCGRVIRNATWTTSRSRAPVSRALTQRCPLGLRPVPTCWQARARQWVMHLRMICVTCSVWAASSVEESHPLRCALCVQLRPFSVLCIYACVP
jgi:hypothetical protein